MKNITVIAFDADDTLGVNESHFWVMAMGGHAAHIPYQNTWAHEKIEHQIQHPTFYEMGNIADITSYLE